MKTINNIFLFVLLLFAETSFSQDYALIYGKITDSDSKPIELVNISIYGDSFGTLTNNEGKYRLLIPANKEVTLVISFIGYKKQEITLSPKTGDKIEINSNIEPSITNLEEVVVTADADRTSPIYRISPKYIEVIPNISGNFESLIKLLPGVSSNNELSSQYSVRGGNFDENLVYVNDIEVYRPFLIRSGQQEGLSFINSEMVSSIKFSAGGFEAKYGDKISSVLDIRYKKPTEFESSVSASLLGGSAHLANISKNKKFTSNTGFRYKTSKYLLNSLNTDAEYNPSFVDIQSFLTYQLSPKIELNFLGSYAHNKYEFIPKSRETSFGVSNFLVSEIYDFRINYDGQEIDKFETSLGALSFNYKPEENTELKLIYSGFSTNEIETFDIDSEYRLDLLENAVNPETYNDSVANYGYGRYLDHARNYLNANVHSISHKGTCLNEKNTIKWGLKFQKELISYKSNKWKMIDSAGYSTPYDNENVNLSDVARINNNLKNNRFTAFLQNTRLFKIDSTSLYFTAGIRSNYSSFNNEMVTSPRLSLSVKPNWERDILFYASWGYYYQPPFYKEFIDQNGDLNKDIKAQKSIHYVVGSDYNCILWEKPFKFTTEVYYKQLSRLIPYKRDNMRIEYSGKNNAEGYATGVDFRLNGEFVTNSESWISLSLLKTEENIVDDSYINNKGEQIEPGYYPRLTDQRVNFNLFFQDYLPSNPTFKVHINMVYGSRLPFSSPNTERYDHVFRMPAYKRVDLGFSKTLFEKESSKTKFKSIIINTEIFNLFNINNTISYLWVKTASVGSNNPSSFFAVPNYLTPRRLNFNIILKF